jgi:hypothetical protein
MNLLLRGVPDFELPWLAIHSTSQATSLDVSFAVLLLPRSQCRNLAQATWKSMDKAKNIHLKMEIHFGLRTLSLFEKGCTSRLDND